MGSAAWASITPAANMAVRIRVTEFFTSDFAVLSAVILAGFMKPAPGISTSKPVRGGSYRSTARHEVRTHQNAPISTVFPYVWAILAGKGWVSLDNDVEHIQAKHATRKVKGYWKGYWTLSLVDRGGVRGAPV